MSEYNVGDKVSYRTIKSGTVLGRVLKKDRDILGEFIHFKVTSRNNPAYPEGYVFPVSPGAFLNKR